MKNILTFLSGKKSAIATILMGIVAYLATKGFLGEPEVILFNSYNREQYWWCFLCYWKDSI